MENVVAAVACGPSLSISIQTRIWPLAPYWISETYPSGWYGSGSAGLVPVSCAGSALLAGLGLVSTSQARMLMVLLVAGRLGRPVTGLAKSNIEVKSPHTLRRQALMFGQAAGVPRAAVHFSRNWITEVWS